jgi:hypothetical protein
MGPRGERGRKTIVRVSGEHSIGTTHNCAASLMVNGRTLTATLMELAPGSATIVYSPLGARIGDGDVGVRLMFCRREARGGGGTMLKWLWVG